MPGIKFYTVNLAGLVLLATACLVIPTPAFADAAVFRPPVVTEQTILYSRIRYCLPIVFAVVQFVFYLFLLNSGLAERLKRFAMQFSASAMQTIVFVSLLYLISWLVFLPVSFFSSFVLPHLFNLSNYTIIGWLADSLKGCLVSTLLSAGLWTIWRSLVLRFPRNWHVLVFAVLAPLSAFMVFLYPLLIDPLFNDFSDLKASPLRTQIEQVAATAGIADAAILVSDKSKQTKTLNAYVTGIGPSARIVLWDTILAKMPADELLTVVAHETGHYVLRHIYKGYGLSMLGLLLFLLTVRQGSRAALRLFPEKWKVQGLSDLLIIPVCLMLKAPGMMLLEPLENCISRQMEHEADAFGIEITHSPVSTANSFVRLSEKSLSDPNPPALIEFWFFSHPSLQHRIDFALSKRSNAFQAAPNR